MGHSRNACEVGKEFYEQLSNKHFKESPSLWNQLIGKSSDSEILFVSSYILKSYGEWLWCLQNIHFACVCNLCRIFQLDSWQNALKSVELGREVFFWLDLSLSVIRWKWKRVIENALSFLPCWITFGIQLFINLWICKYRILLTESNRVWQIVRQIDLRMIDWIQTFKRSPTVTWISVGLKVTLG